MNKQLRTALIKGITESVAGTGASVEVSTRPALDEDSITIVWPDVSASVWLPHGRTRGQSVVAHFYDARRDLVSGPWFTSINEFHRRKATLGVGTPALFPSRLGSAARAIADGSAFAS